MDFLWSTSTNETNFCLTQFFKLGGKCGDLQPNLCDDTISHWVDWKSESCL